MITKAVGILFSNIKACHDATYLYPPGNPIVQTQFENFLKNYPQFLGADRRVTLGILNNIVMLNGQSLPSQVAYMPATQWFIAHCNDRKIQNIVFFEDVKNVDLQNFIKLLHLDAGEFFGFETASHILVQSGVKTISINVDDLDPALIRSHSSQHEASVGRDFYEERVPVEEEVKSDGEHVAKKTRTEEHAEPDLFLSEEDRQTLKAAITRSIRERKLAKVAKSLNLIQPDLTSADRGERELAFSSYYTVVQTLIEEQQNKPLHAILKVISNDLSHCQEADLFAIHFATLKNMLKYYKKSEQILPWVFGVDILADQFLSQNEMNKKLILANLNRILNLPALEMLLKDKDPQLRAFLNSMFKCHGLALVKPLLKGLFESENRDVRKQLLDILHGFGSEIYSVLMEELRKAIDLNMPWFVKRNLLTLMVRQPPKQITPLLKRLFEEHNPRLANLIGRCVFQIRTKNATELGKRVLLESRGNQRRKYLKYIGMNRRQSFAGTLMELFNSNPSYPIKLEILRTLGALDTADSVLFLGENLDKNTLFSGKDLRNLRIAAANALASSTHPKAYSFLAKCADDTDRDVRRIAKEALERHEHL